MSHMAQLGARLIENGFPILPIAPGTKKPGRFTCGEWRDYPGWQKHCTRPTTEHELAIWATWPNAGVGIATGAVVGVDIDEVDGARAYRIEQRARTVLGDTPCVRVGSWPKRLLLYRAVEPFGSISDPLEVLALGRQFVAFAVHPETCKAYLWPDTSPADVSLDELPPIDLAAVHAFIGPMRLPSNGHAASTGDSEQAGTPEAITDALRFIPNDDLCYDAWVRIGLAIRGALGDEGWPLFAEWSATSNKHIRTTTADAWSRFRPTRIGAGTIYHHAFVNGWNPGPEITLNGSASEEHPAQALLDRIARPNL